jgi:regulatory protein
MAENLLYKVSMNKAMALCAGREMCNSDIRKKLISWGVTEEEAEKIIIRLINEKFIDEERYANAFVKDKFRYNKWGRIKIGAALRMKKIPDEVIRTALEIIDEEEYLKLLQSLIEKHKRTVKAKNQYDLKGKLLRHCQAKGFESHLVFELLKETE